MAGRILTNNGQNTHKHTHINMGYSPHTSPVNRHRIQHFSVGKDLKSPKVSAFSQLKNSFYILPSTSLMWASPSLCPGSSTVYVIHGFSQSALMSPWAYHGREAMVGGGGINMESSCEKVNPLQFALNLFKLRTQSLLPIAIANLPFKPQWVTLRKETKKIVWVGVSWIW